MTTRVAEPGDLPGIRKVLTDTDLFPAEMLVELIQPFFDDVPQAGHWFVHESPDGGIAGFGFCRQEDLAPGTWNLLAIAVSRSTQGSGIGRAMMRYIEERLRGERVLIVETSGADEFSRTRDFYLKCGYSHEATIRDFWGEGDDKVIFWKALETH